MPLSADEIVKYLDGDGVEEKDRFFLVPRPHSDYLKEEGAASVDLRLGTWFTTTKTSRHSILDIYADPNEQPTEHNLTNKHYVPLGRYFILHPHAFVLAVTLEWLKVPKSLCGYVTGKSSWGRRGLIIETAPGVHPGFAGCLTLELANVGTIPIKLVTGTKICQLFLHKIVGDSSNVVQSPFLGQRQPNLGSITPDDFVKSLMDSSGSDMDVQKYIDKLAVDTNRPRAEIINEIILEHRDRQDQEPDKDK
jgi:dCTP deaminase